MKKIWANDIYYMNFVLSFSFKFLHDFESHNLKEENK